MGPRLNHIEDISHRDLKFGKKLTEPIVPQPRRSAGRRRTPVDRPAEVQLTFAGHQVLRHSLIGKRLSAQIADGRICGAPAGSKEVVQRP